MDPLVPRSLAQIELALSTLNGCLTDTETRYVDSYWNTLSRTGVEPRSIRTPQEYTGSETLSIVCTQLDMPAKQQRQLVQAWCKALPTFTNVRTLWFHSRVSQALFDAATQLPHLNGLWIKWSGIRSLENIQHLTSLQYLHIGQSGSIESITPLGSLTQLVWLQMSGIAKSPSLDTLSLLKTLKGLGFTGGDGKPIVMPSLAPLSDLKTLEWLHLGALRVADGSLHPLGALKRLRWLGLPNYFAMREYAWLSTRLPTTACDWLAPFCRYHRSVSPCPKCKANCRVMTTGKGSKMLCPSCDTAQLAKYVLAFESAAIETTSDLHLKAVTANLE
jgi:hypothetical protein